MSIPPRAGTVRRGHGALSNPPGRFEQRSTEAVDDGWFQAQVPDCVPLEVKVDRARSVISTNDSPDIPFEQSINPYRGCAHACVYCLRGDTPILMGDGTIRPIAQLAVGSAVFGTVRRGCRRHYARTRVLAHWSVVKPAYRVVLADGTELFAGADHRFLTEHGWQFVSAAGAPGARCRPHLTVGIRLLGTGQFGAPPAKNPDYQRGYLWAMLRAGTHRASSGGVAGPVVRLRTESELGDWLDPLHALRRKMAAGVHAASGCGSVWASWQRLAGQSAGSPGTQWRAWCAGFLAGLCDAGGDDDAAPLYIHQPDPHLLEWTERCLAALNFRFALEPSGAAGASSMQRVRLLGGLPERLRWLQAVAPVRRAAPGIEGRALQCSAALQVVSIEPAGTLRLYDITTGSGDFIANGVVSHNCYARPSHGYLGLSPGLDFETRLFYKHNAGRLLERELARPGYRCKPITLGANTDPYQPIERRLRVTREILEVLARCRHPVTVITKGALILRDLDLLGALARDNLVRVALSITTLDEELKRALEPQAASPAARLRMLRELSAAGVPTGVLVAPVIPGLTDHELERIVQVAAEAGAGWAGYVLLRLPYEVGPLFREWLQARYPLRAQHVLSLMRQMRQGRDNDSRFGHRMRGTGPFAELLGARFQAACRRAGLGTARGAPLEERLFRPPGSEQQLTLPL